MHLKSLTLKGFKSFADKSTLSLEPGITAIVGPNGSGKSNISDAVLWVLGERNAKNLRGQAMEDVIFAGSSARKATGVAEVELVLDNSDQTIPIDYREVVISRRMYRSGESEYLINGSIVRRLDVLDILHDSGLGSGTHSIISQGSLDSILQSKPEDRRSLIEEAAGVLKHKQKMAKSQRRLEKMNNHIYRVRDVVGEIKRQLGPLERKAKRAKIYEELSGERNEAVLAIAVDDLRKLRLSYSSITEKEANFNEQLVNKKQELDKVEAQIEALQEKVRSENVNTNEISSKQRKIAALVERLDSTTSFIRERRRTSVDRANELRVAFEAAENEINRLQSEMGSAQKSYMDAEAVTKESQAESDRLEKEHSELSKRISELNEDLRQSRTEKSALDLQIEELRVKSISSKEALTDGMAQIRVVDSRISELELQIKRNLADSTTLNDQVTALEETLKSLSEQEANSRELVGSCVQARELARKALDDASASEQSIAAQIVALEEVEHRLTYDSSETHAWIESQKDRFDDLSNILQLIKADAKYENLIEAFLENDIDLFTIKDFDAINTIAKELHTKNLFGELRLVTTYDDSFDGISFAPAMKYAGSAGYPLITKLSFDNKYSRSIAAIFGNIIVCSDFDTCISEHKSDNLNLCFATLDGNIVYPNGKVSLIGKKQEEGESRLARIRHIDNLKTELKQAQADLENARIKSSDAEKSLRDAQNESLELSERLAGLKGEFSSLSNSEKSLQEKINALQNELENAKNQKSNFEQIINVERPNIEQTESLIEEYKQRVSALVTSIENNETTLDPLNRDLERVSESFNKAKLELTKSKERSIYLKRVLDRVVSEIDQARNRKANLLRDYNVKSVSFKRLEPLIDLFESILSTSKDLANNVENETLLLQDRFNESYQQISQLRETSHSMHQLYDKVSDDLSAIRVEKARLEMQVENAISVIEDQCNTPIDVALTIPELDAREEVEQKANELNRRIANLGTINPDAAKDYDELKERYDYLAGQLDDLDSSTKSLIQINNAIEERIRDDFTTTFEVVNNNFQEIFSILFPGGNANLSLIDPEDIENTGVEVNAQPAGKRIAKMSLMSGGEKSLTALALLFSLYKTRATPFYILDEVEAALDDTNLRRLVDFVDAMRDTTQIIMITHQRRTMETADVLFGVSMQSDGVTKVISQKLENALRHAE